MDGDIELRDLPSDAQAPPGEHPVLLTPSTALVRDGKRIGRVLGVEIDPATGDVVWTWDPIDHLGVDEMDPQWWSSYIAGGTAPYDLFHWNSIQWTGDGYLISFRHTDAVYKIDTNGQNVSYATALTSNGGTLTKLGSGTLTSSGIQLENDSTIEIGDGANVTIDGTIDAPAAVYSASA